MKARLAASTRSFGGVRAADYFRAHVLENPRLSDAQLIAMSRVPLDKLARTPAEIRDVERRVPGSRELPAHHFAVELMHVATGLPRELLSARCPDLGLTGSVSTVLAAPTSEAWTFSTALHDFTDFLQGAGVKRLNGAVWGADGTVVSALWSAVWSGLLALGWASPLDPVR